MTNAAEKTVEKKAVGRADGRKGNGFIARWSRISHHARQARDRRGLFLASAIFALTYNILGGLDIVSTVVGLQAKLGAEANPFIRLLMDNFSSGWIPLKLFLQILVTVMILWFPHKLVLGIFSVSMCLTGWVVWNNLQIADIF